MKTFLSSFVHWFMCLVFAPCIAGAATEIVSVSTAGTPTFNASRLPSVDGIGRFVAFESASPLLASNDNQGNQDIFLRDRITGETFRLSTGFDGEADGLSSDASISADGRFIAYASAATNIVRSDTNNATDIFLHDRTTGKNSRISVATGGAQSDGSSYFPCISGNGRFVAYISSATNLVTDDTNGFDDVFVRDLVAGTTMRVSVRSDGTQSNTSPQFPAKPAMSRDGRLVVFTSSSSDLVDGDVNGKADVFLHDRLGKTTALANVGAAGIQANGDCTEVDISGDGNVLAFASNATNLSGGNGNFHVFVRDLRTGVISRPRPTASYSDSPKLSADGSRIALTTKVSSASEQVEVVDRNLSKIFAPARASNGADVGASSSPGLSADGRVVVFDAPGNGIVSTDTNSQRDVFARPLRDAISLSATTYHVLESDVNATIAIQRDGAINGAVSVQYAISAFGDTATPGVDYAPAAKTGTLSWNAGDITARTITIPLINTAAADGYRFFTVALTAPTGGAVIGSSSAKVVIRDTESDPVENRVGHLLKITRIESRGTNWDSGLFRAIFTIRNPAPVPSFPGFIDFRFNGSVIATANFVSVPANGELLVDAVADVGSFPDGDVFALLYENTDLGAVLQDTGFAAGFIDNGTAPPSGGTSLPNVGLKASGPPPVTIKSIVIDGPANLNEGAFADYTVKVTLSDNTTQSNVTPKWGASIFSINAAGRFTAGDVAADKVATLSATVVRNGKSTVTTRKITVKNVPATPIITSASSVFATRRKPFTYRITARHEPTSFAATGLPGGLTLNTATGVISGVPDTSGPFAVNIQAINTTGTDTNPITITIFDPSPLTVNINGGGTVTPDLNGSLLDVGRTYTLLAKPDAGQIFAGWSNGITSLPPSLTFAMSANLVLDANFVPNPFTVRAGNYLGIIQSIPASHAGGGLIQAKISPSGQATGKLVLQGKPIAFKTNLRADGTSPVMTLSRSGGPDVSLNIALDVVGSGTLTGTCTSGPFSAAFTARIAVGDQAARAGHYTFALPGPTTPSDNGDVPDGSGFGVADIAASGAVKIAGTLRDGTPFTVSSSIIFGGFLPLYAPLYSSSGSIAGLASFSNLAESDFAAQLDWFKPARPKDAFYPNGWPTGIVQTFQAARYTAPPVFPGLGASSSTGNALVYFNGGGLPGALSQAINLADPGSITAIAPALPKFAIKVQASKGLFSGSFLDPATGRKCAVTGAIQQKLKFGHGLFRGTHQRTGSVLLKDSAP